MNSFALFLHSRGIRCGYCGSWGNKYVIRLRLKRNLPDKQGVIRKVTREKWLRRVCRRCEQIMNSRFGGEID